MCLQERTGKGFQRKAEIKELYFREGISLAHVQVFFLPLSLSPLLSSFPSFIACLLPSNKYLLSVYINNVLSIWVRVHCLDLTKLIFEKDGRAHSRKYKSIWFGCVS